MKKTMKVMMLAAVMFVGTAAFAGPHGEHRHHNGGVDLARGITNLVIRAVTPCRTTIAVTRTVIPEPTVLPPPPHHHRRPAPPPHHRRPGKPAHRR